MRRFTQAAGSECGIALVAALLALLVLSTLTTAFIFVANTETSTTTNYKALTQGRYLAEAGVERTFNFMRYNYAALPETSYDTTKSPVEFNSAKVVLSGRDGVNANYPNSTMQASFNSTANLHNHSLSTTGLNGTYSTSATLLQYRNTQALDSVDTTATEMWQVTSEGSVTGPRGVTATVQVDAIMERRGESIFNYGLFATGTGCGVIGLSSNATPGIIDSWDSSNGGTYPTTKKQTGGDIGANGGAQINGSFNVYGSLSTPMANQSTGPCDASDPNALNEALNDSYGLKGEKIRLPEPLTFDNPPPSSDPANTQSQIVSNATCGTTIKNCHKDLLKPGRFILDPGTYGNLSLGFGFNQSMVFTTGTYNVNSINMNSSTSGVLEVGPGGPVRIQVGGKSPSPAQPIVLNSNTVKNTTGVPSNLSLAYDGTLPLSISGGTSAFGVIYAPNAAVDIPAGDWYGAMVMNKLTLEGGASFHYDAALRTNFFLTLSWRVVSMSQKTY